MKIKWKKKLKKKTQTKYGRKKHKFYSFLVFKENEEKKLNENKSNVETFR